MSRTRYLVLPVLSFAVTATVHSATIYVDVTNCPGPGDGSADAAECCTAFCTACVSSSPA